MSLSERDKPSSLSFFRRRGEGEFPEPAPGLAAGKVVGDFRLASMIGQGGMGQVWEAEQVSLRRRVAVKFVRPERVTAHQLELFAREARAGGRLSHPGIVAVYSHGRSDGLAWIAMELVSGAWTLEDFLDEAGRAPEVPEGYDRHVARFVAEVADAMQAAHEAAVIHRDLKPQNVLVTHDEHPKVTDFGLARITDETALSVTGDFAGTYFYMSPEQVAAKRAGIDHRTDVFSLGVVLYELLALRRPFEGDTSHQVAAQILAKDPPDIRTIRSRVPRDLAVIAGKALEKDRDRRFATMKELAADLRRHLANEPIQARPPTRVDRTLKWIKRNPTKSTAAAIAAVAFAAITGLLVQNVRANRALSVERTNLASSNAALKTKTSEAEASAAEARDNARIALASEERADREAAEATRGRDEVVRLSALQKLGDLVAEADGMGPAVRGSETEYEDRLRKAGELIAELPDHEKKLAELRSKSVPPTAEERARHRAEHPKSAELERAKRHRKYHEELRAALESSAPGRDPTPEEVGLVPASLPTNARDADDLAWPLIDPDRKDWGRDAKGLVLARRAVELAADLPPAERAWIRDSLAWALFANGRFDEAVAEEEQALDEAAADKRKEFRGHLDRLKKEIEEEVDPEQDAERAKHVAELEEGIAELDAEIAAGPEWLFADAEDRWWHNQLEKLVNGLKAFSERKTGLCSDGISPEHGWGVAKRAEFARTIAERSTSGPAASAMWAEAIASIGSTTECPAYGGMQVTPQLGLLPIGRDPASGLWEFAHLATGEPAERGADGKLVLKESTGLVLVLLPRGTFTMGAQRTDPSGPNHDPEAQPEEGPPREVRVSPFFLSKYEMTQGQWLRVAGENPSRDNPQTYGRFWNREGKPGDLLHPVEQVSWFDCTAVLERLGLELPLEFQWEYGARGGTHTVWWCGNDRASIARAGNVADRFAKEHGSGWGAWEEWDDGNTSHARVGSYLPNAFGLHDVIGNVWEWCQDLYDSGSANRVYRGGSFHDLAVRARSADRGLGAPAGAAYLRLRPAWASRAPWPVFAPSGSGTAPAEAPPACIHPDAEPRNDRPRGKPRASITSACAPG